MSERRQSKILQSKLRHLKIYQSSSEMLNFHSEYAQCGHKPEAIFHKGFINKLWKHMLVAHLPWKFGNVICDNKVFVALRHTSFYFNISALDPHQSLFWRFCKSLTCTISMIQLYDPVIFSGITVSENSSTIPVWGKLEKLFWSLWLLCCQLYGSEWCPILSMGPVKIFHRTSKTEAGFIEHII